MKGGVTVLAKKHDVIISPYGLRMAIPCTPSDYRAEMNFIAGIKRLTRQGLRRA